MLKDAPGEVWPGSRGWRISLQEVANCLARWDDRTQEGDIVSVVFVCVCCLLVVCEFVDGSLVDKEEDLLVFVFVGVVVVVVVVVSVRECVWLCGCVCSR